MQACNISYIIATRNRLPFLKITLGKLILSLLPDEEIIVVDGNSNDGTNTYLKQLHLHKKIQQYISQPDRNQAHAWNRGFLLANGKIIKKIMDDDVFDITTIRKCKNWMLKNPDVDICISDTLETQLIKPDQISRASRLKQFSDWRQQKASCFTFCDVHMLIRKNTLSLTGLYDTQFTMIDWEFALRCSFLRTTIAYYTGCNSLTVQTPGNISSLLTKKVLKNEAKIAKVKYNYPGDQSEISLWSKLKIYIGSKRDLLLKNASFTSIKTDHTIPNKAELEVIYYKLYQILEQENLKGTFEFIC